MDLRFLGSGEFFEFFTVVVIAAELALYRAAS